jgi:hypothetical protein
VKVYIKKIVQQTIQILTVEELLNGAKVKMPPQHGTFKKAERVKKEDAKQAGLGR